MSDRRVYFHKSYPEIGFFASNQTTREKTNIKDCKKITSSTDCNIIFPGGRFLGMLAKRKKKDLWRHMVTFLQDPLNDDQLAYDLVRLG